MMRAGRVCNASSQVPNPIEMGNPTTGRCANPTRCSAGFECCSPLQLFVRKAADYKGRIGGITKQGIPGITTEMTCCNSCWGMTWFSFRRDASPSDHPDQAVEEDQEAVQLLLLRPLDGEKQILHRTRPRASTKRCR